MSIDLLDLIKAYKPPTETPKIAVDAWNAYEAAGFRLTDDAIQQLREALKALDKDLKELTDALCGVGAFGVYLKDHRKDLAGSEAISDLMREFAPYYLPFAERIQEALQDVASEATGLLERFSAREDDAKARAPKFDADAPKGTVSLKDLKPVGELPRPRRDKK